MRKNYSIDISIPPRTFWMVIVPLAALVSLSGVVAGILFIDRLVMPRLVHANRGTVLVPSIAGQAWEDAREKLYGAGLRIQVQGREYNNHVARDHIIGQQPAAGETMNTAERRGVYVIVSKGPEIGVVPDVVGIAEYQARRELLKQGFAIGKVNRRFSDTAPKDAVISLSPGPGTAISREMPVDMTISKGVEPTTAEVPTLVGEPLSSAKKMLDDIGLKTGTIESRPSPGAQPGTVVSQSMAPGSSVPFGSEINLVVSTEH